MFGKKKQPEPQPAADEPKGDDGPCAWCEKEQGIKTRGSHGICARHYAEMMAQIKRP